MEYVFFLNGPLSNWYISSFIADNIAFNCMEQYMMYHKSKLFNDIATCADILLAKHPSEHKGLGRKVVGYNDEKWIQNREEIVYRGLEGKFQDLKLREELLNTGDKYLAEANPGDRIWGIGYSEDTAIDNIEDWGENLLGKLLMRLRQQIKENESSKTI